MNNKQNKPARKTGKNYPGITIIQLNLGVEIKSHKTLVVTVVTNCFSEVFEECDCCTLEASADYSIFPGSV